MIALLKIYFGQHKLLLINIHLLADYGLNKWWKPKFKNFKMICVIHYFVRL